eukprot:2547722-Rhodomonas_salina.1
MRSPHSRHLLASPAPPSHVAEPRDKKHDSGSCAGGVSRALRFEAAASEFGGRRLGFARLEFGFGKTQTRSWLREARIRLGEGKRGRGGGGGGGEDEEQKEEERIERRGRGMEGRRKSVRERKEWGWAGG